MDLRTVVAEWYTPAHNGNLESSAPVRVRLQPLTAADSFWMARYAPAFARAQAEGRPASDVLLEIPPGELQSWLGGKILEIENLTIDGRPARTGRALMGALGGLPPDQIGLVIDVMVHVVNGGKLSGDDKGN